MKQVIFIGGLIGTGKTSIAKGMARKLGFYYYNVDAVKKEIYPTDPNYEYNLKNNIPFSDETRIKTFEKVVDDFATLSEKYKYIVVDETLHKKDLRQILFNGAKKYFDNYITILVKVDENIIKERLTQDTRKGHILKDSFGMYLSFKKQFEDFSHIDILFENNTAIDKSIENLSDKVKGMISYDERMGTVLSDINEKKLGIWLDEKKLSKRKRREFESFKIKDSIDGGVIENREVSLVEVNSHKKYPQHYHSDSDAFFIIVFGSATILSEDKKIPVKSGDSLPIPRGMWHGFELKENQELVFISVQSPPIRHKTTETEDFIKK